MTGARVLSKCSGFCNPGFPLTVEWGHASHGRCRKADCPCLCHLMRRIPALPNLLQTEHHVTTVDDTRPETLTYVGPSLLPKAPKAWFERPSGQLVLRDAPPEPDADEDGFVRVETGDGNNIPIARVTR